MVISLQTTTNRSLFTATMLQSTMALCLRLTLVMTLTPDLGVRAHVDKTNAVEGRFQTLEDRLHQLETTQAARQKRSFLVLLSCTCKVAFAVSTFALETPQTILQCL